MFDGGNATTDNYSDKANMIIDNIHIGSFMELMKMYNPSAVAGSITNPSVDKTVSSVEAISKFGEQVYDAVEKSKEEVANKSSATPPNTPKSKNGGDSILTSPRDIKTAWDKYYKSEGSNREIKFTIKNGDTSIYTQQH